MKELINEVIWHKKLPEDYTGTVFLSLDLETSGLAKPVLVDGKYVDGAKHYGIMEIAGVFLDNNLKELGSFSFPIESNGACDEATMKFHEKTGFIGPWERAKKSTVKYVEDSILFLIAQVLGCPEVPDYNYGNDIKITVVGKSVWFDRAFLTHKMPELTLKLNHQMIDVSAVKTLMRLVHPNLKTVSNLQSTHFALDDCKSAIEEAKTILKLFKTINPNDTVESLEDLLNLTV